MTPPTEKKSSVNAKLFDAVAFGSGLFLGYYFKWEAGDLIGGQWISSLILGLIIGTSAFLTGIMHDVGLKSGKRLKKTLMVIGECVYFLIFVITTCLVHLSLLFFILFITKIDPFQPLPAIIINGFLKPYWPLLLSTIIAERKILFKGIIETARSIKNSADKNLTDSSVPQHLNEETSSTTKYGLDNDEIKDHAFRNFRVIALLMFIIPFTTVLSINSFIPFAIAYSFFYLPMYKILKPMGGINKRRPLRKPVAARKKWG